MHLILLKLRHILFCLGALILMPASSHALDPAKSVFQYNCKNWTRLSGLPADRITAVAQDKKGYIWLGAQNGLIRYDGRSFTLIPVELPSARGTNVASLHVAGDGILWFTIWQGGYGGFDGQRFLEFGNERWTKGLDANTLMIARNGSIWAGTVEGWGRWNPRKAEDFVPAQALQTIISISEDPSGRVWLGSPMAGLFYWENGSVHEFDDHQLKTTIIQAIVRDNDNDLWVGTTGGLFRYDSQLKRKAVYFPESAVTSLLVDRHGVVWVGTSGTGLCRFHAGEFSHLGKNDGLGSDSVTSLLEDEEGSLWMGTVDGLSQLSDLKFPVFSANEGLKGGSAVCVAAAPKGGLWVGSDRGASYFDGVRAFNINDPTILINKYVRRVFVAANGDVYLGDGSRNIVVLREDKVVARFSHEYWPETFLDDGDGVLVGFGSYLFRIERTQMEPYKFDGVPPKFDWINGLARGKDGEIWAATNAGLFKIEGRKFRQWTQADGLKAGRVFCVMPDPDGGIWAGTPAGLLRVKGDHLLQAGTAEGLADARIFAMAADLHGSLWLSSGLGILRVSRDDIAEFGAGKVSRIKCEMFGGLDSVKVVDRTDQGHSACRTTDGRIWFPTSRGVMMIDPEGYFINKVPPRIWIERVRVRDRDLPLNGAAELQIGDRGVEFFFAVLSFIASEKTQVRYQLKGFDSEWIDGSQSRSITYNNLPPGKYVFQIKAANADGVWSTEDAQFAFTLPAPFYTRTWFYLLCVLTAGLILYAGYRIKVRQIRQSQQRLQLEKDVLETKVELRTNELASSVSLLQATLNSTADGIVAIKHSGAVASYNLQFEQMWQTPPGFMSGIDEAKLHQFLATQVKDRERFAARTRDLLANGEGEAFDVIELVDGRIFERYGRPQIESGKRVGIVMNYRDITQRKQAEARLAEVHQQLLETSRQAGMAEVATSVLHNVGNVLNSVNVSATLVTDHVRESKVGQVARLAELFQNHNASPSTLLTDDPKGQKIVHYLSSLGTSLLSEQKIIADELANLSKNVEHIKEVVAMQQRLARVSGVSESLAAKDLFEDALRMNIATSTRPEVAIVRDYESASQITTDRHKVLQILINLINNAEQACSDSSLHDKQIVLRIRETGSRVQFTVIDNGVGIPKEDLTRIFRHGFTTKKNGHGFGLHSAALAAKELGGALTAHSEGRGLGATFVLDLPAVDRPPTVAS